MPTGKLSFFSFIVNSLKESTQEIRGPVMFGEHQPTQV